MRYAHCILLLALCCLSGCGTPDTQQVAGGQTATATTLATVTAASTSSPTPPAPTQPAPTLIPTSVPATPTTIPPTTAPSTPTVVPATPTAVPPTAVPQPAAPAEFIVASRGTAIVAVAADGSTRPIAIDGIELRSGPIVVSTDGSWIAGPTKGYEDPAYPQPLGEPGLVLYNTASGERQQLTQPGTVDHIYFAPDNTALIFTTQNWETMTWQIHLLDLRTREQRIVQEGVDESISLGLVPLAWTPEGILAYKYLIFGADGGPEGLFLINPNDGSVRTIIEKGYTQTVVAPDGKQVAVITGLLSFGIENPTSSLKLLDLASGASKEIEPEQPGGMFYVRWSPDSTKLIYQQPGVDWTSGQFVIAGPALTEPQHLTLPVDMHQLRHLIWRDNNTLLLLVETGDADTLYELPIHAPEAENLKHIASIPAAPAPHHYSSSLVYIAQQ